MTDSEVTISVNDLPIIFTVKYLGNYPAKGLWGMKHTRKPVDFLVARAKNLPVDTLLPVVNIEVSKDGVTLTEITDKKRMREPEKFSVDSISYGVQDVVYTRVFSMIVVKDETLKDVSPFVCHSFVCDSREQTRRVTYALAAAFQDYGKRGKPHKRLAIDLRTPEQQAEASDGETDA